MEIWHRHPDTPRSPARVTPGDRISLRIGTWPIEADQSVHVEWRAMRGDGAREEGRSAARWESNDGPNSYWLAELGPFARGDRVEYLVRGVRRESRATSGPHTLRVGPRINLALVWHQHQPAYARVSRPSPRGSYAAPWVRLHALRDYYSMASLIADQEGMRATINLSPILLEQLDDYGRGATDEALELTLVPAERLASEQREKVLTTFFEADWHTQILPHERYAELFRRRAAGERFDVQDLRDLQAWSSLAWFSPELRESDVKRFVDQGRGFSRADVEDIVAIQLELVRQIVPLHRALQQMGVLELTATPYAHPILPILIDSDAATIDLPGATRPRRFAHPEDADAQIARAIDVYSHAFGRAPRGMWPAEGAVSQSSIELYARHGIVWIASDRGVLGRSGQHGYEVDRPDVQCRPYRAEDGEHSVAMFFRDTALSDAIGFRYASWHDQEAAARDFVAQVGRLAHRLESDEPRVVTVVLDGENAWGAYPGEARPFLRALYRELAASSTIETTTPSAFLGLDVDGAVASPAIGRLERVHDLFTGSWIDEAGSAPGVDLGTWIGEPEENRAIELLGSARDAIDLRAAPAGAREALFRAEGSDWLWWYGSDQYSGHDDVFDDLFRAHLADLYRALGRDAPPELERSIVARAITWRFTAPVREIDLRDRLLIVTNCPGRLVFCVDGGAPRTAELAAVGGVMSGHSRHQVTLGPFDEGARILRFTFHCGCVHCPGDAPCCRLDRQEVLLRGATAG